MSETESRIRNAIELLEVGIEVADKPESNIMQQAIDILSEKGSEPKQVNLPLNLTFELLTERAVKNAKAHRTGEHALWVAIVDTFAVGSTTAHEICRCYNLDPYKIVSGARCVSCNP